MFNVPEQHRITSGLMASSKEIDGNNGVFIVPFYGQKPKKQRYQLQCIASDGEGWEHVSVTIKHRLITPNWAMMNYVKGIFWGKADLVVQFHPPEKDYVNIHPHALHLWRKANNNTFCEKPPLYMV